MFYRSLLVAAAAGVLSAVAPNPSHAQEEAQTCPERELVKAGTFEMTVKSAGLIIGARWGSGTATLNSGEKPRIRGEANLVTSLNTFLSSDGLFRSLSSASIALGILSANR